MSMRVDGLPSQNNGYKVNVDRVKQEIEKTKRKLAELQNEDLEIKQEFYRKPLTNH